MSDVQSGGPTVGTRETMTERASHTAATDIDELLDRLERLVVRFLARRMRSPRSLWRLQLDLLRLQRDLQATITAAKGERSTTDRKRLSESRQALWHARRFGDALAWILFGNERRQIDPLSHNAKVPVLPDGHAAGGLTGAAEALSARLGFPLIHDITDVLRVGDITFFRRGERPKTVEVKTSVVSSRTVGRQTRVEYKVTAIWPAGGSPPPTVHQRPVRQQQPVNARVGRQLARMTRAVALQDAPVGVATEVDGRPTLILESKRGDAARSSHWPLLRRMIRRARRTGYASAVADRTVMYAAFYSTTGLDSPEQLMGKVPSDLIASGIFLDDPSRNALFVLGMPDPTQPGPDRYLPYYLYPMPRRWVVDILRGRLVVFALLNPGRVGEALATIGVRTELGEGRSYLRALAEVDAGGGRFLVEMPLDDNITEMVMEARPLADVVDVAEALIEGMREQLPAMLRADGLID